MKRIPFFINYGLSTLAFRLLPLCVAVVVMTSCANHIHYAEYQHLPMQGWLADSALVFQTEAPDTACDIIINIRHNNNYPYQNMWLVIENTAINSLTNDTITRQDTVEFYLADQRGRWLAGGFSNIHEMPVLYKENIAFPPDTYLQLKIKQAMREDILQGINDLGVIIQYR